MARAEVGDDVLDGDPTTRQLEAMTSELLGKERALFFPSGVQANQVAVGLLGRAGAEVVVEAASHIFNYEEGAAPQLWGVQLRPVETPDGILAVDLAAAAFRPGGSHLPRTLALVVENTHNAAGGKVVPLEVMKGLSELAQSRNVRLHIDGARLWNAATALNVQPADVARYADTVMVSFSKGLGCPVGACLAGPADLMEEAVILRRRLGGGMRQSGFLAAAGIYALENNLQRLDEDHKHAAQFASFFAGHEEVRPIYPETNIVMLDLNTLDAETAASLIAKAGVLVSIFGPSRLRAVMHLDVTETQVRDAAELIASALKKGNP